jgi:hypothetical protein
VIEALFLWREASLKPPPIGTEWSFYTALVLASRNSAREARGHLRLKNCGRDFAHIAGDWRAMEDGCVCKGTGSTAVRFVG